MEAKTKLPDDTSLNCHVCGHFGTDDCAFDDLRHPACRSFLSWSDLCQREMAAIKRAQRTTYLVAGAVALLAIVVMILPSLIS